MSKFAYLIICHDISATLLYLVEMLDDERNDIYIHMDAKYTKPYKEELRKHIIFSQIFFIENRVNVFWGDSSQIRAEYLLFDEAYRHDNYLYYHLLSGQDLPIKTQDYIHTFFEKNYGYEFIGFSNKSYSERIDYIYLFPHYFRSNNILLKCIRKCFIFFQKKMHKKNLKFRNTYKHIRKGTNWVSVTHEFVEELLRNRAIIESNLKYSYCSDEIYKQTIAYNSKFKNKIYCYKNEFKGCMRLIDWNRGSPYSWKEDDIKEIICSDKLFCRKINDVALAKTICKLFCLSAVKNKICD